MDAAELADDHHVIDEFAVAKLLNIKLGAVRGLRRRGVGPPWFRVDGRSPRYTLAGVKRYIEQLSQGETAP